ncbi:MAG: VCBS repeat-containing protein [Myxococcota bacterium]
MKWRSAVLVLLLASCREPTTQVLVRLATDIPDMDAVVIVIEDQDDTVAREVTLPPERLRGLPADGSFTDIGSFGVVPLRGDATRRFRVRAQVTARDRDNNVVRFETRARTGFVNRRTIRLDIYLARLCIDLAVMCEEEGLTCGIEGCVPEDVPPEILPPIDDPVDPDDPIDPRGRDAGVDGGPDGVDGGTDAGIDAPMDAPQDVDGPADGAIDDTGVDAIADAGTDAGAFDAFTGFDGGPDLMPRDPPVLVFPWDGYREPTARPTFAWRAIPGTVEYRILIRRAETTAITRNERVPHMDGTTLITRRLTDALTVDDRWTWYVVSCDGPNFPFDCGPPLAGARYLWTNSESCDFNGDGNAQAVVGQDGGDVLVWQGATPTSLSAHGRATPTAVACADLDGDDDAELIAASADDGPVAVFDGTPLSAGASPFNASATRIVAADFNWDATNPTTTREDIVLADPVAGEVWVSFDGGPLEPVVRRVMSGRAPDEGTFGRWGRDLAVADVDADGHPDLIIGDANHPDEAAVSKGDGRVQIVFGDPAAPFSETRTVVVRAPVDGELFGFRVAAAGIDNEGRAHFAVSAPEAGVNGTVYIFESPAPDAWTSVSPGGPRFASSLAWVPSGFGSVGVLTGHAESGPSQRGAAFLCGRASCANLGAPATNNAFLGFEVGTLGAQNVVLSRAAGQNGLYVGPGWSRQGGSYTITARSRLPR